MQGSSLIERESSCCNAIQIYACYQVGYVMTDWCKSESTSTPLSDSHNYVDLMVDLKYLVVNKLFHKAE